MGTDSGCMGGSQDCLSRNLSSSPNEGTIAQFIYLISAITLKAFCSFQCSSLELIWLNVSLSVLYFLMVLSGSWFSSFIFQLFATIPLVYLSAMLWFLLSSFLSFADNLVDSFKSSRFVTICLTKGTVLLLPF